MSDPVVEETREETPASAGPDAGRILIVDDEESIRRGLGRVLRHQGYDVETEADAESAFRRILRAVPDLVITDLNLPGRSGMDLISDLAERGIDTTLLVLTGHGSIDSAIEATRRGVYDYLVKPVDAERLTNAVRKAIERSTLRREVQLLRREMVRSGRFEELVGRSGPMLELFRLIEQVGPTDAPVLITGESGTGKELVARALHRLGPRADRRLVAMNCAAIPDTLLESELFGHEKGAFTGATAPRAGCFELADGGTLLLDEIGDMPADLQSKLLRVLEDGVVRRLGGESERRVDVRVVSSTNVDLEKQLADGRFREDLFYRLNVFQIRIPPLRERPDDIPLLAERFREHFAAENHKAVTGFSEEALVRLRTHDWPGNARELRNSIQRAVIMCPEGEIQPHHLPDRVRGRERAPSDGSVRGPAAGSAADDRDGTIRIAVGTSVREAERRLVLATLKACEGNRTKTASMLGVTPKTLYTKLRRWRREGDSEDRQES